MLKKNSWIVALFLALSLTVFIIIGCVDPLKVEEDTETYEEYPLDKGYNAWAGQVYQKGWATGGIVFQGKGDALVTAKDLGYDIEMFQKATKLKIEMPDASYPRSGVDIIWGGEDASGDATKGGGMWNQQPIAGGSGDIDTTYAKKDGNVLIIDLTKALKNYSSYTKAAKLKIVLQVNAPSYGDVEGLVQKAFLMIPNTPPPFVSIKNNGLSIKDKLMYYTSPGFPLAATFNPTDATNQSVVWQIYGWSSVPDSDVPSIKLPEIDPFDGPDKDNLYTYEKVTIGGNEYIVQKPIPDNDPNYYKSSVTQYNEALKKLQEKVWWLQEKTVIDDSVFPAKTGLKDIVGTLVTPAGIEGEIFIQATVKNGRQDSKGQYSDVVLKDTVSVRTPLPFTYKFFKSDGTLLQAVSTIYYGAVDNNGVSGGKMDLITKDETTKPPTPLSPPYTSYTITLGGGYHNSHHYFLVDLSVLGTGNDKLSNYKEIKIHYKAGTGDSDLAGKTLRARASLTVPERSYWAGPWISTVGKNTDGEGLGYPAGSNTKDLDITFNLFKDDGNVFKNGAGADLPNPQPYNGRDVVFDATIKDASKVYIWFSPHATEKKDGNPTTFTISNVEFIHK